jgi:UDP-2-acetamido-3-amino-2,3-dideoxy-glucuronate N-acetyltransferase
MKNSFRYEIEEHALIGASSVITKNVKPHAMMVGNPAKQSGWVNQTGEKLKENSNGTLTDSQGNIFEIVDDMLVRK